MGECNHTNVPVKEIGSWDRCPLNEGHNCTSFIVLRCSCGAITGFPEHNFKLAQEQGTPEVKAKLKELVEGGK